MLLIFIEVLRLVLMPVPSALNFTVPESTELWRDAPTGMTVGAPLESMPNCALVATVHDLAVVKA